MAATAIASSAASTAAISATNTSMNVDGSILNQTKDIGRQTIKDTTSKESLENMAIAGATAFITAGTTAGINELSIKRIFVIQTIYNTTYYGASIDVT